MRHLVRLMTYALSAVPHAADDRLGNVLKPHWLTRLVF
jgi:hypothetical protein